MADTTLPAVLELLLDHLSEFLPPSAFALVESALYHSWALMSSLASLVFTLVSSAPSSWDAEKILPPLITLLAAYLALVSFYRTTGWMIRTAFAFVKWGFIVTTLGTAAGYILANGAGGAAGNRIGAFGSGLIPMFGGYLLSMFGGEGSNETTQSRSRTSKQTRKNPQSQSQTRPNAWDSWDRHRDWQYTANTQGRRDPAVEIQKVVGDVLGAAGRIVTESGWWETTKGVVEDFQAQTKEARKNTARGRQRAKAQKSSKSR